MIEEIDMNSAFSSGANDTFLECLTTWSGVKELGYTLTGIESKILSNNSKCRIFVFTNQIAHRTIEVTNYCAMDVGPVSISNTQVRSNIGISNLFVVKDFLGFHAADLPKEFSREKYVQIVFEVKRAGLEPFLEFLGKLFMGPLKPILTGETWEDVPWDDTYK
jgi:hypothetical protein